MRVVTATDRFRVLLLGGFAYGDSYEKSGARIIRDRGRSYSTRALAPFVQASDKFLISLKTPLAPDTPVESVMRQERNQIHWAEPGATAQALVELGVDAVSLANNHALDQGESGLKDSLETLESFNISYFGAGTDRSSAEDPFLVELPAEFGGGSLAIRAAMEFRNDYNRYGFYADAKGPGTARVSVDEVPSPAGPEDALHVAFPHWGRNYDWVSPRQKRIAGKFAETGYDVVVGAGAHTIQEISREDGRWILYSIGNGNFQSGGRWKQYEEKNGVLPFGFWTILDVTAPNEDGIRRVGLNLYPVYSDNRETDFQPHPVSKDDFDRIVNELATRAFPPGAFPNEAVKYLDDELGYFIRLEVSDWPVGASPIPVRVPEDLPKKAVLAELRGPKVQNVGVRHWIAKNARKLEMTGWVRNREDYVETVLQGSEATLDTMTGLLNVGPDTAEITSVDIRDTRVRTRSRFRIRRNYEREHRARREGPRRERGTAPGFLKVGEILGKLRTTDYEYLGNPNITFRGFELSTRPRRLKNRFFLLVDDDWHWRIRPRYTGRRSTPPEERPTPKERLELAKESGAAGFIIPKGAYSEEIATMLSGENILLVDDGHAFANALVRFVRIWNPKCSIITVTGSVGKSTTQQMVAHALRSDSSERILAPTGNQNFYDNSLMHLSRTPIYDYAVLEVGHGSAIIQKDLGTSFQADIAVVTQIAEAHLQDGKNLAGIARMKSQVFEGCPPGGVAIINADAPFSDVLIEEAVTAGRAVLTYGENTNAAVRLIDYDPKTDRVTARVGRERYDYTLGVHGKHNAINSLAVLATLWTSRYADIDAALRALANFSPVSGRGDPVRLRVAPGVTATFLNEAYNANPASVRATLASFASRPEINGRRIALLGDMLELDKESTRIHAELAPDIEEAALDAVLLFGPEMKALSSTLEQRRVPHVYAESLDELVGMLPSLLHNGDHVLAKASRGMGLSDWISGQKADQSISVADEGS